MKFKKLFIGLVMAVTSLTTVLYARGSNFHLPKNHKYSSPYRQTHNVRPYFKRNGTYIQRHRAGNPRSGIHCHNNVCY